MEVLGTLGLNWQGIFWHLINFILLLVVLQRLLYKPVLRMLDERAARVKESMERAEFLRHESVRIEEESRRHMDEARRQAAEILANARRMAEREREERRARAEEEARRIIERAQAEAAAERERLRAELRTEVADLAINAASYVIGEKLDPATHRRLVEQFLAQAAGNGRR